MALDLLRSAKGILKTDDLTIDNVVFKLHYRVTVAILILLGWQLNILESVVITLAIGLRFVCF